MSSDVASNRRIEQGVVGTEEQDALVNVGELTVAVGAAEGDGIAIAEVADLVVDGLVDGNITEHGRHDVVSAVSVPLNNIRCAGGDAGGGGEVEVECACAFVETRYVFISTSLDIQRHQRATGQRAGCNLLCCQREGQADGVPCPILE